MSKKIIVTHHAPDLDAITSCWLLKRFDAVCYNQAKVFFVNPGEKLEESKIIDLKVNLSEVVYVDTGGGPFDHHDKVRALQMICASSLIYQQLLIKYPDLKNDLALKEIIDYAIEIDHFRDIYWPQADNVRYLFMLAEIIRGAEFTYLNNDESQLHFGLTCLDNVYAGLKNFVKARETFKEKGQVFIIKDGRALAIETRNDELLRFGLKKGLVLVLRKDPVSGIVRIKVNPKSNLKLQNLYQEIIKVDSLGFWFLHPNQKILINGSKKNLNQRPTPLTLDFLIKLVKKIYE